MSRSELASKYLEILQKASGLGEAELLDQAFEASTAINAISCKASDQPAIPLLVQDSGKLLNGEELLRFYVEFFSKAHGEAFRAACAAEGFNLDAVLKRRSEMN